MDAWPSSFRVPDPGAAGLWHEVATRLDEFLKVAGENKRGGGEGVEHVGKFCRSFELPLRLVASSCHMTPAGIEIKL